MTSGVYSIRNDLNGKVYIGSSNDIDRRWRNHITKLNSNCHANRYLQRSWNKYGAGCFTFSILEICSEEMLLEREQWYLDTQRPQFNIVTNVSAPMKGKKHSPETRQRISRSLRGNTFTLGYKHSEASRKLMSAARKGKPQTGGVKFHSEETKRKISAAGKAQIRTYRYIVSLPNGEEYLTDNLTQFCLERGLNPTCLGRTLRGIQANHRGYSARFVTSILLGWTDEDWGDK